MYTPAHFAETRPEALLRLLREHPLGMLVTHGPEGLDADHLPFEFEPGAGGAPDRLIAHVARANPLWQRCPTGTPVMVVFRGPEAYVSPNWYPSKHDAHRQVPTWNYAVVHAHGTLTVHDDERFVRRVVARLTRTHEARTHEAGGPRPWKMGDAPADYLDAMLRQIVGIEVTLTALVGKVKASQNKAPADREGAADGLAVCGQAAMATLVRSSG